MSFNHLTSEKVQLISDRYHQQQLKKSEYITIITICIKFMNIIICNPYQYWRTYAGNYSQRCLTNTGDEQIVSSQK
jgi:hypothetical protein